MDLRFWRKKWLLTAVIITVVLVAFSLFLATLKFDYDRENDAAMQYFSRQPGMPDTFMALERLTPSDAVVLCWWDYGRSVREWSHREVIEAYPSREIADSVGSTRSFLGNLGAQLFAKWGSHEKIQDIALAFMLNEEQSLQVLRKYKASYVLVFVPDELEKFYWIARIAGYNSTDYLTKNEKTQSYEPTARGEEVTLLRLIYDDTWQPRHFTKIFNNEKAKIYRINY
jgi:asparagine N-glycosylation enzyme membrane subunit Stt3